jgi:hypothetical protein
MGDKVAQPVSIYLPILLQGSPYERVLLDFAKRAAARGEDGDHEVAVVTAQMAVEVMIEQTIGGLLRSRGLEDLDEPLSDLLPSYNIGNERVLRLYDALSGEQIQNEAFWPNFKEHVKRRNQIVHRGMRASRQDAEESIAAVEAVLAHLQGGRTASASQPAVT